MLIGCEHNLLSEEDPDVQAALSASPLFTEVGTSNLERNQTSKPPALKRRNAMRRKKKKSTQPASLRHSWEPAEQSTRRAISNPASPSEVVTNRVQNLESVLNPNVPLVPQAVHLGDRVQYFDQVLPSSINNATRRSARIQAKRESDGHIPINYRLLHTIGKAE